MTPITTIDSGKDLIDDLYQRFQEYKIIQQKAFYSGKGAEKYYSLTNDQLEDFLGADNKYFKFLEDNCLVNNKDKSFAFISLGCGNAEKEVKIVELLQKNGYKTKFFGVDSSEDMIILAKNSLKKSEIDGELICADFTSEGFFQKFSKGFTDFDFRVFTFLGGTLGNVEQSFMADILYDLTQKGDKLWMEVGVRDEKTKKEDMKLFARYLDWIDNPQKRSFLVTPLELLGIQEKNGKISVQMVYEKYLDALRFVFRFRVEEKTVITLQDKTVILLPGNEISLLTIRWYDPEGLQNFFEQRNFTFVEKMTEGSRAQFLFEKK